MAEKFRYWLEDRVSTPSVRGGNTRGLNPKISIVGRKVLDTHSALSMDMQDLSGRPMTIDAPRRCAQGETSTTGHVANISLAGEVRDKSRGA